MTIMNHAAMNQTPPWRHLLWKDFHQVRPALVGSLGILACLQLLYLVLQLFANGTGMQTFQHTYTLALLAPTLAAIACSGLLIGHERQTRTWNWSSSLPLDWRWALASKFIVWFVSSLAMVAILLALYGLLYQVV